MNKAAMKPKKSLKAALESGTKCYPINPISRQDDAPASNLSISESSIAPNLRNTMLKRFTKKQTHLCVTNRAIDAEGSKSGTAKIFFVGFDNTNTGLESLSVIYQSCAHGNCSKWLLDQPIKSKP